jgi:hypothetical protein
MKRPKSKRFLVGLALLALALGMGSGPPAWAESSLSVGSSTSVHLDFQIYIDPVLTLQVGTDSPTIDRVSCTLSNIPGTGAVAMTSSGPNPVPVEAKAQGVGPHAPVRLLADSAMPMSNGAGGTIPLNQISWAATGNFSSGTFNNSAAQLLDTFSGSGNRKGTYSFSYANVNYYAAGTYNGRVTYTLSSP